MLDYPIRRCSRAALVGERRLSLWNRVLCVASFVQRPSAGPCMIRNCPWQSTLRERGWQGRRLALIPLGRFVAIKCLRGFGYSRCRVVWCAAVSGSCLSSGAGGGGRHARVWRKHHHALMRPSRTGTATQKRTEHAGVPRCQRPLDNTIAQRSQQQNDKSSRHAKHSWERRMAAAHKTKDHRRETVMTTHAHGRNSTWRRHANNVEL